MLPQILKNLIIENLAFASQQKSSFFSLGFKDFVDNKESKTDQDYCNLVLEIKNIISSNPIYMKAALGEGFDFFNILQVVSETPKPTFNNISIVDKMLKEIFAQQPQELIGKFPPPFRNFFRMLEDLEKVKAKSTRNNHIDEVDSCYEDFKAMLNDIFGDLVPAPHCQIDINPRVTKIFTQLQKLRDLACKELKPV